MKAKQIPVSFSKKTHDQEILAYLLTKKDTLGISEYIKNLISNDMKQNKKEDMKDA